MLKHRSPFFVKNKSMLKLSVQHFDFLKFISYEIENRFQ